MPFNDLSNWCFENEFKLSSTAMYIIRAHPSIPKNRMWLLQLLGITLVNISCLLLLTNSIFLHDAKSGNFADANKNFSMLIIVLNSNIKYYTLIYYRESIAGLIKIINRDYDLAKKYIDEEKNIVLKTTKRTNAMCKKLICTIALVCAMFPLKAFFLMVYYYTKSQSQLVPMFDMTFPYFIEKYKPEKWGFCGIFALCFSFDTYACFLYLGFEPLIPIFTLHTCGQLELTSHRISRVISESNTEHEMKEKLKIINLKLQELYSFVDEIQKNFMLLMEINMKTTTIIIPCNAFQILQEFRLNGEISLEFVLLFVASIIHFLSPCYYSDILMESSENFRQAIYSCGWEKCRYIGIRKTILLMLTRATKPFSINSVFYFISLDTFSEMCSQAYAIFNLMTAAWT